MNPAPIKALAEGFISIPNKLRVFIIIQGKQVLSNFLNKL